MRAILRVATALAALAVIAPLAQCQPPDKNGAFGALAEREATACCTEFRVGYDMLVTDFGVAPPVRPKYTAFAQAMGDYVVMSTRLLEDVTGACRDLATGFGGREDDPAVKGRSGSEASYAWCNLAARRLTDAFNDSLQPAGHFTTHFAPASCWVDTPTVARCEAACSSDASCQEAPAAQRCDKEQAAGMCTGKCTGTCEGSAIVPASCDGKCDAECEGACAGSCDGSCEGVPQSGGQCRGVCTGTCEGACRGRCTGVCHYGKAAAGRCDGPCKGGCSVPYATVSCATDLGPPRCPVDPACEASCKAIGQARASCTVPSMTITLGDDVTKENAGSLAVQTKLRALELDLPKLMNAATVRGPQLSAEAKAAYEAGGSIVAEKSKGALGNLGLKGAACAVVMQSAGEQALQDLHVAIDAAQTVLKTLPTR